MGISRYKSKNPLINGFLEPNNRGISSMLRFFLRKYRVFRGKSSKKQPPCVIELTESMVMVERATAAEIARQLFDSQRGRG